MVTYDAFRDWIDDATFKSAKTASPYLDKTDNDDLQLDLVLTYDGPTGQAYDSPKTIYSVFASVFTQHDSMDDVTIQSLRDHYDTLAEQNPADLTEQEQSFVEKEAVRSHLGYWADEGFFEKDATAAEDTDTDGSEQDTIEAVEH